MKNNDSKIIAAIVTVIAMLLLWLLLWFVYINSPYQPEDEGIEVSFGDADAGGGQNEMPMASLPVETSAPAPVASQPSTNDLMVQDDESLQLQKQREQEKKRKAAEEAERIRKQKEEQARIEAERLAKEKALAEQRAKEQKAIENANKLGGLFGQTNTAEGGNGTTSSGSSSVKGNPLGHGTSGGNSWSLNGRSINGKLAQPTYSNNVEGVVVVAIRVNAQGQVISATKGQGTTISDQATIDAACAAARKASFSEYKASDGGSAEVVGTITYVFKLK